MKLLISGTNILVASEVIDQFENIVMCPYMIFRKDVLDAAGAWAIVEGELPPGKSADQCEYVGGEVRERVPSASTALKAQLVADVDDEIAKILSKSTRFQAGYIEREAAAVTFKANDYQGDPTSWITRFATNTGMSAQQATDLILSQATGLRAALKELEDLRMDKYLIYATSTEAQARSTHANIVRLARAVVIP